MSNEHSPTQLDSARVLSWLKSRFAEWLEVKPEELDADRPIAQYGLDSINAVTLSVDLEEELGITLETALLWDYPTLGSLATYLTEKLASSGVTELPSVNA
jgi:acyl carrier protein